MSKESPPPPPTSFSSLPDDVALDCRARISRFHYPTLSLVSKGFRTLIASPELEATRSFIGKPENHLCVCLRLYKNPNPLWFIFSPIPKQKLKPIVPWFPNQQYPQYPTVVSNGSQIYIIGGFVRRRRSNRVSIFDYRTYQWRRLPKMRQPRVYPAASVIDGKIYVIGGFRGSMPTDIENSGEVYDPKTNTWEPILLTSLDLTVQNVFKKKHYFTTKACLVINKVSCLLYVSDGKLYWREDKEGFECRKVYGLAEQSSNLFRVVANSGGGGRVTVWWKSMTKGCEFDCLLTEECETKIWCAEISLERRGLRELRGFVEWSKEVFTIDRCDYIYDFISQYVTVTY